MADPYDGPAHFYACPLLLNNGLPCTCKLTRPRDESSWRAPPSVRLVSWEYDYRTERDVSHVNVTIATTDKEGLDAVKLALRNLCTSGTEQIR